MDNETLRRANELKDEIERLDYITSRIFYKSKSVIERLRDKFTYNSQGREFVLAEDEVHVLDRYLYEKWAKLERELKEL